MSAAAIMAGGAWGQTQPSTEDWSPPAGKTLGAGDSKTTEGAKAGATSLPGPSAKVAVTEWVILVADQYLRQVNRMESIDDTLPEFIDERRSFPSEKEHAVDPMPIGVIRLTSTGTPKPEDRFDVSLNYKNGRALGTWPNANVRSSGILWEDLKWQSPGEGAGATKTLPEGSWIAPLRSGEQRLQLDSIAESFLLYDVELDYPVNLLVTGGGEKEKGIYHVVQPMDAPMHDLTFYQKGKNGQWKSATLASLAKTPGSTMLSLDKTPPPAVGAGVRRRMVIVNGQLVPQTPPPATAPATTQPHGTDLIMVQTDKSDDGVLAPWGMTLANAGVTAADQKVALAILRKYALTQDRLTAVYRMDPAELERLMPLEVVPQPEKVTRIALVVVTGIDPKIQDELDTWITQLGSKSWVDREAAMAKIKKVGAVAKERLQKAANDKDLEIAYRAEQLLEGL